MARKKIIAYFMHEDEQAAATDALSGSVSTESYVLGEIDEDAIDDLRNKGLIVQELDESDKPPIERLIEARTGAKSAVVDREEPPGFDPTIPNYYTVHLAGPVLEPWRDELKKCKVKLLEALAPNIYTAFLDTDAASTLRSMVFVRSVRPYSMGEQRPRISEVPRAAPPDTGAQNMLTLDVRLHDPEDMGHVLGWLADNAIAVAGHSRRKIRLYALEGSTAITELRALPEVQSIDEYVVPELHNDHARDLVGLGNANPPTPITETGQGQIVGVADTGIDDQHPDFQGRIAGISALGRPGDYSDTHGHGTHVAGSVLGDGSASNGQIRGTAPDAELFFQSILDANGGLGGLPLDLNDLFDEAYQQGARIHNNSWGSATASRYTFNSIEVDEFVADHRDMLVVISAGNEGVGSGTPTSPGHAQAGFVDWLSIGSPASCKNALTVGASRSDRQTGGYSNLTWSQAWPNEFPDPPIGNENVSGDPEALAAFSSRGPCDDRRIKPDLVAPGTDIASPRSSRAPLRHFWGSVPGFQGRYAYMGGTSMAAPIVSGCAALVRQYYIDDRGHMPSAALLRATLINGTRWLSGQDSQADYADMPNFHQGFGCIDMPRTIPNQDEPALRLEFLDDWEQRNQVFSRTGQRYRFIVSVGAAMTLRFCLAWTDTPARALQNNLNLQVQSLATGQKWLGNADLPMSLNIPDPDNNVELIRIATPPAGDFLIQVAATNLLDTNGQDFALVVAGDLQSQISNY